MMGFCIRMAVWTGVATSAIILALPACVLLVWVGMVGMWLLGLLGLVRFLLRLWNPKLQATAEERRQLMQQRRQRKEARRAQGEHSVAAESYAESRLLLVQQYLEDQLFNTLRSHHLLHHVAASDSQFRPLVDADVGSPDLFAVNR